MADESTPLDSLGLAEPETESTDDVLDNLINNTAEVSQLLDDTLSSINDFAERNLFSDFDEDDDEDDEVTTAVEKRQAQLRIVTLVRVFTDEQPLKVAYIRHGLAREMEPFTELIMTALTSRFRGKHAEGAYSQSLIEAKEQELKGQFKLLEIEPTAEERADAKLFDEHYRSLV